MTRQAIIVALVSTLAVLVVSSRTDQGFYSDPAVQMKSDVQYLAGESPRPNDLMQPAPNDLSRDIGRRLSYWAPGTPLAFLPFVRAGLSPAHAARSVAALAVLAGSIGWVYWFAGFGLPAAAVVAFAVLVPWMRFASNALFLYTPEILIFATVPWILIAALAAERATRGRLAIAAAIGFAAGALYVVKFSATFVTAGVFVWFAWRSRRADGPVRDRVLRLVAFAVAAAIPIAALSALNHSGGGSANLLLTGLTPRWRWANVVHAIGMPALAAADLDSLLMFVLMHPTHGVTQNMLWLSLCGLPAGVLLIVLAVRARHTGPRAELARAIFATSTAAILVTWTLSTVVSIEARHVASAGFAVLPLAMVEGRVWWRDAGVPMRRLLAAIGCAFVIAPLAYGVVSVFAKAWRYPAHYRPAASGIYNPLLAKHDASSVVEALQGQYDAATDIWYTPEPLTGLDLPGRSILGDADYTPVDVLRRERFVTSRRMRVHVLLPPRFEQNGKGAAIRGAFPQAAGWSRAMIAGAEYDVWTSVLQPDGER